MKKLAIVLILVLTIALIVPTPTMAKKAVIPADLHRLRVDATIATGTTGFEETTFVVHAIQKDESGNAIGRFTYTVTNTASGRKHIERGIVTAMRVVGNVVVVGGIVLTSNDGTNIGTALIMGFEENPDEAAPGLHFTITSREDVLNIVNTIADQDLFVVTTALVPIESGYVVLKPKA